MTRVSDVAFAALLSLVLVRAQDTTLTTMASESYATDSAADTGSSTSTQPITQTVAVGRAGHTFEPDVIQISPGNYVEFDFYPTNHSVIRAEYEYPCVPYEMTGVDKIGFFSGFKPVDAILANPPKWTLLINDTSPIFYYCGAPGSCLDFQMVGVINPNASVSLAVQKQYAANSTFMLLPGQNWPDEDNPFQTTSTATATYVTTMTTSTSPTSTTASPTSTSETATATAVPSTSGHSTLSAGAIAGIAIGAAAVAIAAAALLFICGRRSRRNRDGAGGASSAAAPPAYVPPPPATYGYISPAGGPNKHLSVSSSMPVTDAFGNPTPTAGAMYHPFGPPPPQQGPYGQPPPHMQGNPLATPPMWPSTPSNDIFGTAGPQPQQMQQPYMPMPMQMQMQDGAPPLINTNNSAIGTDAPPSLRASSPSSVNAVHPVAGVGVGGIEAFLQRQGRMSPTLETATDLHAQSSSPLLSTDNQAAAGPYEMSATGTMSRSQQP